MTFNLVIIFYNTDFHIMTRLLMMDTSDLIQIDPVLIVNFIKGTRYNGLVYM